MVLRWEGKESPGTRALAAASSAAAADLDNLPLQTTVRVAAIEAPESLRRHLLEIGFTEGCSVTYLMTTPFGDPKVYRVRGASIALRRSEARCIRVSP